MSVRDEEQLAKLIADLLKNTFLMIYEGFQDHALNNRLIQSAAFLEASTGLYSVRIPKELDAALVKTICDQNDITLIKNNSNAPNGLNYSIAVQDSEKFFGLVKTHYDEENIKIINYLEKHKIPYGKETLLFAISEEQAAQTNKNENVKAQTFAYRTRINVHEKYLLELGKEDTLKDCLHDIRFVDQEQLTQLRQVNSVCTMEVVQQLESSIKMNSMQYQNKIYVFISPDQENVENSIKQLQELDSNIIITCDKEEYLEWEQEIAYKKEQSQNKELGLERELEPDEDIDDDDEKTEDVDSQNENEEEIIAQNDDTDALENKTSDTQAPTTNNEQTVTDVQETAWTQETSYPQENTYIEEVYQTETTEQRNETYQTETTEQPEETYHSEVVEQENTTEQTSDFSKTETESEYVSSQAYESNVTITEETVAQVQDESQQSYTEENASQQNIKESKTEQTPQDTSEQVQQEESYQTEKSAPVPEQQSNTTIENDKQTIVPDTTSNKPLTAQTSDNREPLQPTSDRDSDKKVGFTNDEITETVSQQLDLERNNITIASQTHISSVNILNAQKAYIQQMIEQDEYGKGKKTVTFANRIGESSFGKADLTHSIDKNIEKLRSQYENSAVVKTFFENKGIKTIDAQNFDQVENVVKSTFNNSIYSAERSKFKLDNKNFFETVDGQKVLKKEASVFFNTKNAKEALEIQKSLNLASKISSQRKMQNSLSVSATLNRKITSTARKLDNDTTKSMTALSDIHNSYVAIKRTHMTISSAKVALKIKRNNNKLLRYEKQLIQAAQQNTVSNLSKKAVQNTKPPINTADMTKVNKKKEAYKQHLEKVKEKQKKALARKEALNQKAQELNTKKALSKTALGKRQLRINKMQKKIEKMTKAGVNQKKINSLTRKINKKQDALNKSILRKQNLNKKLSKISKLNNTKVGKFVGKLTKPLQKVFGAQTALKMFLKDLLIASAKLIAMFFVYIGIMYLMMLFILSITGITQISIFDLMPEHNQSVTETPLGKTYLALKSTESQWVYGLTNIAQDSYQLSDYDEFIDWNIAINGLNDARYSYSSNRVISDPLGLGIITEIDTVDGGNSITFLNVNNPGYLSNIKEILAMASVYYEDGVKNCVYDAHAHAAELESIAEAWLNSDISEQTTGLKKLFKNIIKKFQKNPIQDVCYSSDINVAAYGAYALSLYEASHDAEIELVGIEQKPLAALSSDSVRSQAQAMGNRINNTLILCPKEKGCSHSTGEPFTYSEQGDIYVNGQTVNSKGTPLSQLVYIEDPCYNASNKDNNRCWEKHEETHTVDKSYDVYKPSGATIHVTVTETVTTVTYTHNCKGHDGSFCAGHITIATTGIIHSIDEQYLAFNEGLEESKVEARDETESTFNTQSDITDTALILKTDDIFDVDIKVKHSYTPKGWGHWSEYNTDTVVLRLMQDWDKLYGLDLSEESLSETFTNITNNGSGFVYIGDYSGDDVSITCAIISSHEGNYGSINGHDNDAISVGFLQWHANRALELLRTICQANPANAQRILGMALYNEITNPSTNWSSRYFDADEQRAINNMSQLLNTSEGKKAQDDLYKIDVARYMSTVNANGITEAGAVTFLSDIINQYGSLCSHAYAAIRDAGGDLDAAHDVLKTYQCNSCGRNWYQYQARRDAVYAQCLQMLKQRQ